VQQFIKQEQPCIESLKRTLSIYQTYVLDSQGKDEFENYIMNAKKRYLDQTILNI